MFENFNKTIGEMEEGEISDEEANRKQSWEKEANSSTQMESMTNCNSIEEFTRKKREEFEKMVRSQAEAALAVSPQKYPMPTISEESMRKGEWVTMRRKESPDPNEEFYFGPRPIQSNSDFDYRNREEGEATVSSSTFSAVGLSSSSSEFVCDKDYRSFASEPTDLGGIRKRFSLLSKEKENQVKRRLLEPGVLRTNGTDSRWERPTICKYFRERGYCREEEKCMFSHDAVDSLRKGNLCKYYQQGYCKKSNICPLLHGEFPCKAYHKGECSKGSKCRFSHAALSDFTRPIYQQMIENDELAANIKVPPFNTRRKTLLPVPDMPTGDMFQSQFNGPPSRVRLLGKQYDTLPPPSAFLINPAGVCKITDQQGPLPVPTFQDSYKVGSLSLPSIFAPPASPQGFRMLPPLPPTFMVPPRGPFPMKLPVVPEEEIHTPVSPPPPPPVKSPGCAINDMLRKIKGKMGEVGSEEVGESPSSPPPVQHTLEPVPPQTIPCHGLPSYRLILVDVSARPELDLSAFPSEDKFLNDPRIKNRMSAQLSEARLKKELPPRDPRLSRPNPEEAERAKVLAQLHMVSKPVPPPVQDPMMPSLERLGKFINQGNFTSHTKYQS